MSTLSAQMAHYRKYLNPKGSSKPAQNKIVMQILRGGPRTWRVKFKGNKRATNIDRAVAAATIIAQLKAGHVEPTTTIEEQYCRVKNPPLDQCIAPPRPDCVYRFTTFAGFPHEEGIYLPMEE
jgi:hypothetical protein